MKYVIGIDSGGSKFLIKAAALNGKIVGEYTGEPAGFRFSTLGQGIEEVNCHIHQCLDMFEGERENCAAIVCGSTGIDSEEDYRRIKEVYENLGGFSCPIQCVNDAEVALHAATGGIGAIVIAGTGSVAFGRNKHGETSRSGGWWFSMGADGGSGTFVALRALQHCGSYFDQTVPADELIDLFVESLGIKSREDLLILGRNKVSLWSKLKLPTLVDDAAAAGSVQALRILDETSKHTFDLAHDVVQKLRLHVEPCFSVGVWGSAIVKSPIHYRLFQEKLIRQYRNVDVILPQKDAATGAVEMALELYQRSNEPKKD